ncbi:hypothetical protein AMK26_19595 [Streptomyces sp. CB03234]|uniref:DUF6153 family protein n=1 Tax=Streptomyces sp. (strain CB03234) TaxID=1703937 RepID=UPI00093A7AFD|nr:DUF6153 family protein [Streptomyces sp. CB03234]OKK03653.1 hypothetical protein AMK26_19595 [Streptomyces sp. CB03234]
MSPDQHRSHVRPPAYRRALLILAVLAGVLAMHGLAPGSLGPAATGHAHARQDAHVAGDACEHVDEGHSGAGHAEHADSTCAAGGVSTAPAQPPLLAGTGAPGADVTLLARAGGATATDRAPPDLAQLQLLRI